MSAAAIRGDLRSRGGDLPVIHRRLRRRQLGLRSAYSDGTEWSASGGGVRGMRTVTGTTQPSSPVTPVNMCRGLPSSRSPIRPISGRWSDGVAARCSLGRHGLSRCCGTRRRSRVVGSGSPAGGRRHRLEVPQRLALDGSCCGVRLAEGSPPPAAEVGGQRRMGTDQDLHRAPGPDRRPRPPASPCAAWARTPPRAMSAGAGSRWRRNGPVSGSCA